MSRICLTVCRFCFAAWVGAAALFVVNGIAQVRHPAFDSVQRSQLALLRFPAYYVFGFGLVGTGLATLLAGRSACCDAPRLWRAALGCIAAALVLMVCDYLFVYRPLAAMLQTATEARPAAFQTLHQASTWINFVHVGLVACGGMLINWPGRPPGGDSR